MPEKIGKMTNITKVKSKNSKKYSFLLSKSIQLSISIKTLEIRIKIIALGKICLRSYIKTMIRKAIMLKISLTKEKKLKKQVSSLETLTSIANSSKKNSILDYILCINYLICF